jgi:hypothetical protein
MSAAVFGPLRYPSQSALDTLYGPEDDVRHLIAVRPDGHCGLVRSLGLGKYEAAFRENDIDETVLPGLTHETLKELGVASIGHRVKLLDAIAALRN